MRARILLVTMAGLVLAACASQTPEPVPETETSAELTEEAILAAQRAGYSLVTRNGEQVLCRQDPQTGSRLQRTTICLTAREWARVRSSTRQALHDMTRGHEPACRSEGTC